MGGYIIPVNLCNLYGILFVATTYALVAASQDITPGFRSLFTRISDKRLSSLQSDFISNLTLDGCASECVTETRFQCKSFSYDNLQRYCFLYSVNLNDRDVHLIDAVGRDHYETSYLKKFKRLPNHEVNVMISLFIDSVSSEECARRCILETRFRCRGFNHQYGGPFPRCLLVESTGSQAAMFSQTSDFYEKETESALSSFINYGMGILNPVSTAEIYQKSIRGLSTEGCAQLCLDERSFNCISFDYTYEDRDQLNICSLSQYISANVQGLVVDSNNPRHNHFERIERYLDYFYATPHALIQGNNLKTFTKVTPNRCARHCMEEDSFVCRSFDYKVIPEATCLLSSKTQRDVGGLGYGPQGVIHHFEMKPILDCGGNLTEPDGGIASPNWPRNYAHHETCVWNIKVSRHKVIMMWFTHFELGLQSSDSCSDTDDRLIVTDVGFKPYCVMPNTKKVITKTNEVTLQFISNAQVDAQGFRVFYSAEWTCDVYLKNAPGEFASPKWPGNYPSGSRCSWRVTAPEGQRVRVTFSSFALEQHSLGHCNDKFDHVRILDGGTVGSPLIGLYCGLHNPFAVLSSGRDILVQFSSDNDPHNSRQGFHARFVFETMNGTIFEKYPRYIDLGEKEDEEWEGTKEEDIRIVGAQLGSGNSLSEEDSDTVSHDYRSTMWGIITCLLLAVLVLAVALFLVVRHYRQKISGQREKVVVDERSCEMESVPLQSFPPSFQNSRQFNNLVNLSGGGGAAAAGVDDMSFSPYAMTKEMDDEKLPSSPSSSSSSHMMPRAPPRTHRPQSSYGKYHDDNLKNINVEKKTQV